MKIPRDRWEPYVFGPEYRLGADILCPTCNRWIGVLYNHEISPTGVVTPSFVCTHAGCTFHEFISLEGWDPNVYAERRLARDLK